jgi:hypothetical protein
MMMFWLSPSPWLVSGGWDRALAAILVLPRMCLILKLYSCRSACHHAILQLRFLGDFQYVRLVWSVRMVNVLKHILGRALEL